MKPAAWPQQGQCGKKASLRSHNSATFAQLSWSGLHIPETGTGAPLSGASFSGSVEGFSCGNFISPVTISSVLLTSIKASEVPLYPLENNVQESYGKAETRIFSPANGSFRHHAPRLPEISSMWSYV